MLNVPPTFFQALLTKKDLGSWYFLFGITVAIGVVMLLSVRAIMARARGTKGEGAGKKAARRRPIPDAWVEAGRRVEPIRMDEPEPPTAPEP